MGIYAQLNDVKKILRASSRERIRFPSNALKSVTVQRLVDSADQPIPYRQNRQPKVSYDLVFLTSQIIIDPSFYGRVFLSLNMKDDADLSIDPKPASDYDVFHQPFINGDGDKRDMMYGSSDTNQTFDYEGIIQIPTECFEGIIRAGDTVRLEFEADISDEDAEFFIENAEVDIDNMLAADRVSYLELGEDRLFKVPDIPPAIQMATQYLAAYYIYTAVYAEEMADTIDTKIKHFSQRWHEKAIKVITDYAVHARRLAPSSVDLSAHFQERAKCLTLAWHNPARYSRRDLRFYRPAMIFDTSKYTIED
jgi:hypothetical protein